MGKVCNGEYWENTTNPKDSIKILLKSYKNTVYSNQKTLANGKGYLVRHPASFGNHKITGHEYRDGARIYPGHTGSGIDEPSKPLKQVGMAFPAEKI